MTTEVNTRSASPTKMNAVSIMALALMSMGFSVTTPAMSQLAAHFAGTGVNVSLVSQAYAFTFVPCCLIAGILVGNKIRYKWISFFGVLMMLVFGVLPAFLPDPSFGTLVLCRCLFGVGIGAMNPVGKGLVLALYSDTKQARMLGLYTTFTNIGGIIMQQLGGFLAGASADMGWQLHYFGYFFLIIGVIFSLFLPDPPITAKTVDKDSKEAKGKLGIACVLAGLLMLCVNLFNQPVFMGLSVFTKNILDIAGDPNSVTNAPIISAQAMTCYTIAGMIIGIVYGSMYKALKRWILPVGLFLGLIGYIFASIASTDAGQIWQIFAATILIGIAFGVILPGAFQIVGVHTSPIRLGLATAITIAIFNCATFLASFWLQLLAGGVAENSMTVPTLHMSAFIGIFVYAVLAIILCIVNPFKKTAKELAREAE
ncbi:MAG: MFS transporter [Coriobacteriales bacterium]|jgi:MFS family permease